MNFKTFIYFFSLIFLLCGCGGTVASDQSLPDGEPQDTIEANVDQEKETLSAMLESSPIKDSDDKNKNYGEFFINHSRNVEFSGTVEEYDYAFAFAGLYLSNDGKSDMIYINPMEVVWNWETERWLEWGGDDAGYFKQRDIDGDEILSFPINENTEFHMWNDGDPYLNELCERLDIYVPTQQGECVTRNPEVFLYYFRTQLCKESDNMQEEQVPFPFFLILNEDGTVRYVIETGAYIAG